MNALSRVWVRELGSKRVNLTSASASAPWRKLSLIFTSRPVLGQWGPSYCFCHANWTPVVIPEDSGPWDLCTDEDVTVDLCLHGLSLGKRKCKECVLLFKLVSFIIEVLPAKKRATLPFICTHFSEAGRREWRRGQEQASHLFVPLLNSKRPPRDCTLRSPFPRPSHSFQISQWQ